MKRFYPEKLQFTSFERIHIHQLKATDLLESTVIGEVILTILADFEGIAPEIVIQQIINKLQTVSKNDAELKKYINQLNVFARLRGLQDLTIQNAAKMPIVIDIENDSLVKANSRRIIQRLLELGKLYYNAIGFTLFIC